MIKKRSSRFNIPQGGMMPPGGMMQNQPFPMDPNHMMHPGEHQHFEDPSMMHHGQSSMYPGFQMERLLQETKENRRRIDNLARRVGRIENYLQIRDNNDLNYTPEDRYSF